MYLFTCLQKVQPLDQSNQALSLGLALKEGSTLALLLQNPLLTD